MNIFRTFEIFFTQPLALLKESIVQIIHIKTKPFGQNVMTDKVNVEISKDLVQVAVINSEKVYNLLSNVTYKRKLKKNNANQTGEIYQELTKS